MKLRGSHRDYRLKRYRLRRSVEDCSRGNPNEVLQFVRASGGGHDVAAPVLGVRATGHEALGLERVEHRDHGRTVDAEPFRRVLLGGGLVPGQEQTPSSRA